MKLSASIYSKNQIDILSSITEFEKYSVDFIHIDCNDDLKVFDDIKIISDQSNIPIDLHLITPTPEAYYNAIENSTIHRVCFQIEELGDDFRLPTFKNTQIGIAIKISNPALLDIIQKYHSNVDFILIMTTTPGKSGGIFDKNCFITLRQILSLFPNIHYCVDGGVNHEIAYILRLIGIDSIVIGNYLMNHENMASAILQLKSRMVHSEFKVTDYMIASVQLPVVEIENESFLSMLQKMEDFKLGIVFCIDQDNKLVGVITNADVRRKLLTKEFSYDISLRELTNFEPKKITSLYNTSEMLEFIRKINFPILVLPIIDEMGQLVGAISFHSLIKED